MKQPGPNEAAAKMISTLVDRAERDIARCKTTPLEQFNRLVHAADRHAERGNKEAASLCSFAALRIYRIERDAFEIELSEEFSDALESNADLPIRTHLTAFELGIAF